MTPLVRRLARVVFANIDRGENFGDILRRAEADLRRRFSVIERGEVPSADAVLTRALTPDEIEACAVAERQVNERLDQLAARAM